MSQVQENTKGSSATPAGTGIEQFLVRNQHGQFLQMQFETEVPDDYYLNIYKGKANETQVGGTHYKDQAIQPWDFILSNNLDFFQGNIVKYVVRWKEKGGVEDLKKAQHYLQKYIESHDTR